MNYDVFICFKNSGKNHVPTPDATHARKLYESLRAIGFKVFFSEESLAEQGRGNFSRSIETALESARVLILVASCREHVESQWVEAEWDSFLQDLRSGNKEGELFIFNCGKLSPSDLPLFLRRQQMFSVDCLNKLIKFVAKALPRRTSLRDFVRASLHCFHPEKDEDRIYLLAVHPGTVQDSYHVTAYWGARSAKRLNSQMKAMDVSVEVAKLEVEKAKREKLHSGYVRAPFTRILTNEARSRMLAALGLPARIRSPRPSNSKPSRSSKATPTARKSAGTLINRTAEAHGSDQAGGRRRVSKDVGLLKSARSRKAKAKSTA